MAFDSFNPTESLIPNDGDLVFDATTGEGGQSPAETVLPYIEQHADFALGSQEENDGSSQGIVVNWATSGPGDELSDWLAAEREVLAQLSTARGEAAESAVTTRSAIATKTPDQISKSDANGTSRRKTGPARRRSPAKPGDAHP